MKASKPIILESARKKQESQVWNLSVLPCGEVSGPLALFAQELHDLAGCVKTKRIHFISDFGSIYFWLYQNKSRIAKMALAALLRI